MGAHQLARQKLLATSGLWNLTTILETKPHLYPFSKRALTLCVFRAPSRSFLGPVMQGHAGGLNGVQGLSSHELMPRIGIPLPPPAKDRRGPLKKSAANVAKQPRT